MKHAMLLHPALFIPRTKKHLPWSLGTGSIVGLLTEAEDGTSLVSASTGVKNERYVQAADAIGRQHEGWLAARTPLRPVANDSRLVLCGERTPLTFWDRLREILAVEGFTMVHWTTSMKAADRQLARQVIRELGGAVPKTKDNLLLKEVLLRVTQAHTKEDQMAAAKKTKAAAPAKAEAQVTAGSRSNSAMASAAAQLRELKLKHPHIARLENESAKSSHLAELRDHINEQALAAREGNKPQRASKLSAANRAIRKLQRRAAAA